MRTELAEPAAAAEGDLTDRARVVAMARHFANYRPFYRAMLTGPCAYALNRALIELISPVNERVVRQLFGEPVPADLVLFLTGGAATVVNAWVVEGPEPLDPEAFADRLMTPHRPWVASGPARAGGRADNAKLEARDDVLTYTTAPLDADTEVIGEVSAEIWFRSSLAYADVFVRVCDVDPRGRSTNVCDGLVSLAGADRVSLATVRLWPTAYRFGRGHRIRVQVSSGAFPRFARNPAQASRPRPSPGWRPPTRPCSTIPSGRRPCCCRCDPPDHTAAAQHPTAQHRGA